MIRIKREAPGESRLQRSRTEDEDLRYAGCQSKILHVRQYRPMEKRFGTASTEFDRGSLITHARPAAVDKRPTISSDNPLRSIATGDDQTGMQR